ncbi:MAG: hypothetical protein A2Y94_07230 [Caldithrix sp. RBG_13_44_9]|nr:MAG: hypothetical protein A2Y94_07230 [Caldithrix sp. RBG_13_44_9]
MRLVSMMFLLIMLVLVVADSGLAQLTLPRISPKASVSQTVGITDITIEYCRPGVKGRVIWGELVPYNEPWRTGANEATIISFSSDVMVAGNKLAEGKYALVTIPTASEWTVIFSKQTDMWGAMGYKPEEDVLRIQVKPVPAEFTERMMFYFDNLTDNSADAVLQWEKIKVLFTIQVDVNGMVMEQAQKSINWRTPYQAANYAFENNLDLAQAQKWLELSKSMEKNFSNTALEARIMEKQGKKKEAVKVMEEAITMGKAMSQPPYNIADMEALLAKWKGK